MTADYDFARDTGAAYGAAAEAPAAPQWQVWQGDCRERLAEIADASVHLVVTDPPYFLDGLDNVWAKGRADSPRATGSVGGLPVGMKFDPAQGAALQAFLQPVFGELHRVLKPGGFFIGFSQPRLYHRMAIAAELAGFEIRDMMAWHFTKRAQFKAFSLDHFVRRMSLPARVEKALLASLAGWKTPQLRPNFEAMFLAQKPRDGTFLDNWRTHGIGLMDATQKLDGAVPSNVMKFEKSDGGEKIAHLTVKPRALIEHLIRLFSREGQLVLDPFVGSGTTCVAARRTGRRAIGIEVNPEYAAIARRRVAEAADDIQT
ncbi:MAG TPA: site-specific DNA-methyltransferase [Allosphingosinicella sp.]|nr:site-specific DNA-methyltransferase [Allosphingosinicella sp.]